MSTGFAPLREPFTSVLVYPADAWKRRVGHARIGVWVNHARAGELIVRSEEAARVLTAFTTRERVAERVGLGDGSTFLHDETELPDDTCVVSDYGTVTTLGELRRQHPHEGRSTVVH